MQELAASWPNMASLDDASASGGVIMLDQSERAAGPAGISSDRDQSLAGSTQFCWECG
jgi:hypothetical protein